MARLWHGGAEWQNLGLELQEDYQSSIQTTIKRSGGAAWEHSGNIANDDVAYVMFPALGNQTTLFNSRWVYIDSLPDSSSFVYYADIMTSADASVIALNIWKDTGKLYMIAYFNNYASSSSVVNLTDTYGITEDMWFQLEMEYDSTPANGSEIFECKINGSTAISVTNLNYTNKNVAHVDSGIYNGTGSSNNQGVVYVDDVVIQNSSGSVNNSWVSADEKILVAPPSGAGSSAAQAGTYTSINEIPATTTATSSANRIELDNNGSAAYYTIDAATAGVGSSDTISAVMLLGAVREETSGTTSYQMALKSSSGGTPTTTTAADAGNTTVRTNPNGTTAFGRLLISETDPTTASAWTPTGTNSLANAQIGALSGSANDIWFTAIGLMVGVIPASSPPAPPADNGIMFGVNF